MNEFDFEFDCTTCEFNSLFGEGGSCLNDTFCICPDGYSGVDDWLIYQDCHVNIYLATIINYCLVALKGVGFLSSLVCFLYLCKEWKMTPFCLKLSMKDDITTLTKNNRNGILQLNTIRANLFLIFFTSSGIVYNLLFLLHSKRDDNRVTLRDNYPFHGITLTISYSGILGGLFLMLKTWFDTLPDVAAYGELFSVYPFFVKYPNFVPFLCNFMIFLGFIIPFLITVLLPLTGDEYYIIFPNLLASFSIFFLLIFGILQFFVISNVMIVYKTVLSSSQRPL